MHDSMESEPPESIGTLNLNRRSALGVVLGGAAALTTGIVGLVLGFLSNALGRRRERPWIRIGPVEDLDASTFQYHVLQMEHTHAWIQQQKVVPIFIKDLYPQKPRALLARCTHLGCSVKWDAAASQFQCPCHGGVYDAEGNVVAGPPPTPLTRLEVKIEDEICFVRLPDRSGGQAVG